MTAEETLKLISKQWCNLEDLMKLGEIGRNNALKIKKEIRNNLIEKGYKLPNHNIPMNEVIKYLNIDINYLESRIKKGL